jgi:acetyl-CoA synthetase
MSRVAGYAPVIEYMGGTEIGGGYLTCSLHQPMAPACFTTPTLGTELFLPKEESENWMVGEVFIVMRNGEGECPAMGLSTELLNFDHHEKYFERGLKDAEGNLLREHGDVIQQYDNGLYASGGRSDDGININGIKTSSLDIENYIKDARIEGVSEVAAVGVRPPGGGEDWLVIFAVASQSGEALLQPVREAIKARNPQLARVKDVVVLDELPLTASGKLRRRYLQDSYLEQVDAA